MRAPKDPKSMIGKFVTDAQDFGYLVIRATVVGADVVRLMEKNRAWEEAMWRSYFIHWPDLSATRGYPKSPEALRVLERFLKGWILPNKKYSGEFSVGCSQITTTFPKIILWLKRIEKANNLRLSSIDCPIPRLKKEGKK